MCHMIQNPFHDCRVLDAGNDLGRVAALLPGLDIDLEYPSSSTAEVEAFGI